MFLSELKSKEKELFLDLCILENNLEYIKLLIIKFENVKVII